MLYPLYHSIAQSGKGVTEANLVRMKLILLQDVQEGTLTHVDDQFAESHSTKYTPQE